MIAYVESWGRQREVARAHRYLRPNGTLGASGKPDPKTVRIGRTLYRGVRT
jgi:hypothetical protein